MTKTPGAAAIDYAAQGWPVFPLKGKRPLTQHGCKDATTSAEKIAGWWQRWPEANVGIATGKAAGFWVLDIDGDDGSESLGELEVELGALPSTRYQMTGGGGMHLLFAWVEGREVRNKQSLRQGIDVRGEGGYIVAPPSNHSSGGRYEWGNEEPIEAAPAAWLDLVCPVRKRAPWDVAPAPRVERTKRDDDTPIMDRARKYLLECEPAIQGSGGHNALLWAARAMVVGFELPEHAALRLLWDDFNPRCTPPWNPGDKRDRRDFERKVTEAATTPSQKRRGWLLDDLGLRSSDEAMRRIGAVSAANLLKAHAEPSEEEEEPEEESTREPFPLDALPERVASFCRQVAESHGVDESFAGLPALTVAGAAMGNAWRLRLKKGFDTAPILWSGLVAPSGTNKSGPLREIVAPLQRDIPLTEIAQNIANPQGRSVVSDATLEAVVSRLQENPRGLLIFRDELAGWVKGFNAYRKGGGGDEQAWIEFWGGGSYQVDRKTNDERIYIHSASCCVLGGIQPSIMMECFDPSKFASGLVPRVLIAYPPPRPMYWSDAEVDEASAATWDAVVVWLRTRPFLRFETGGSGRYTPRIVEMTPDAHKLYKQEFNRLAERWEAAADDNTRSLISKARVIAARLILIHHGMKLACEGGEDLEALHQPVTSDSAEAGVRIAEWCFNEQVRAYGLSTLKADKERAQYLYDAIRDRCPTASATVRQVQRLNGRKYKDRNKAIASMALLVREGKAEWADEGRRKIILKEAT